MIRKRRLFKIYNRKGLFKTLKYLRVSYNDFQRVHVDENLIIVKTNKQDYVDYAR